MNINDSLKTIATLTTKVKMLYRQLTHLKVNLAPLQTVQISDHDVSLSLYHSLIATTNELMFLISESIIEEYNNILTPVNFPEHAEQILRFKSDIKPAMKRFNKWGHRRKYRNTLVAHNLRFKDNSSVFDQDTQIELNAPQFDNDFVSIYYLHLYMTHCLGQSFGIELLNLNSEKIIDKINFTSELTSLNDELPTIKTWADERKIQIEELNGHINFLKTKSR